MRRAVVPVAVALLVAGCTSPSTVTGSTRASASKDSVAVATASPLSWHSCTGAPTSAYFATVECASLTVPLDHASPSGPTVTLALSRVKHTAPDDQYQGAVLVNPGGPGEPGLYQNEIGEAFGAVGRTYDWIGFDTRGVGASTPALNCDRNYMDGPKPPYAPYSATVEATWLARARGYAAACRATAGALLDHMSTADIAQDVESIRTALDLAQISYYGFSYGTYLGAVYASMFPDRVRRMVLDSNVDPRTVWYQGNLDQDVAIDQGLARFFTWVAAHDDAYGAGRTPTAVRATFEADAAALAANPVGTVGSAEWYDAFTLAAYSNRTWPDLATALQKWRTEHDVSIVDNYAQTLLPAGNDNLYATYLAVQCSDAPWPTSWARWKADNTAVATKAPLYTWLNAWWNVPCLTWSAKPRTPVPVDGTKVAPVLLVDETLDAATPYVGSLELRTLFPRSVLLAEPGGVGHGESIEAPTCVTSIIRAYLDTGALPPRDPAAGRADVTCAPQPDPTPSP